MAEATKKLEQIMRRRMDTYVVQVFRDINNELTDEELEQLFHELLELIPTVAKAFLEHFIILPKPQRQPVMTVPLPKEEAIGLLEHIRDKQMTPMTKEEMRKYIESAEGQELSKMTPEEAFEAGKRGDGSAYDLAGRKVALSLLRFFERHPEINPQLTYYLHPPEQDTGIQIDSILDEQAQKEIDEVGPTGAMFGWALSSVKWLLKEGD